MPPEDRRIVDLLDTHYGGDVSRVVLGGVARIPGDTVLTQRDWLEAHGDELRRLLLHPPYGNPSMCVNLIVEPSLPQAEAGYVIMEAMGYPHFSGSNSICVVTALLESGRVPMEGTGTQVVLLEAPAGLVRAEAEHDGRHVTAVTVACDPAWVARRGLEVEVFDHERVVFDLVWSGCWYAVVDAGALGFGLTPGERAALTEFAHELCLVASPELDLTHPVYGRTSHLSFVCFAGALERGAVPGAWRSRSATYVHPGVLCACPTGTGTAARLALLAADGIVGPGEDLVTVSPTGSTMTGRIEPSDEVDDHASVQVSVTGRGFTLGRNRVVVNRDDALVDAAGIWRLLDDAPP